MEEYHITIKKDEAGYYIATCSDFTGCCSYGLTLEEALENIEECIKLCQEELEEREGRPS